MINMGHRLQSLLTLLPLVALSVFGASIDDIVSSMTLAEKVGQMTQIDISVFVKNDLSIDQDKLEYYVRDLGIGSILNSPFSGGPVNGKTGWNATEWRQVLAAAQNLAKYPLLYGLDSIHGATYVRDAALFPQQIALAATFNTSRAFTAGRITARDTRAAGVPWLFSPVLDLAVQPLWPRVYETFGEDPFLASSMATAIIQGMQITENDGGLPPRAAACMKHFIAYGLPESGHDRSTSSVPDRILKQLYVPSFRAAVDAGVMTAMESYNEVGGVPIVSSSDYLNDLLRGDLGFKGMLVTDYQEIENLVLWHKVTDTYKDATRIAMEDTSIDMSMVPLDSYFTTDVIDLVNEGLGPESRIDESVTRILQLKQDLGLFDYPIVSLDDVLIGQVGQASDWDVALDTSRESITLLKNEAGFLPLSKTDASMNIFVTGPTCNSKAYQTGGWSIHWQGPVSDTELPVGYSMLEGIQDVFQGPVTFYAGVDIDATNTSAVDIATLDTLANAANVIVACVGEPTYTEKPGDIDQLDLPAGQTQYVVASSNDTTTCS